MSLWKVFERSVRLYENKTALIFGEERISYKQLYEKSCHIADHLYEIAGGKEQQKVFILSKNSIDMVALMLACMRRNLIACPVNWRLSARELAVILKNHNYVIRICDEENRGLLEAACSFIPEETFVKADLRDLTDDKKAVPAVPAADPDGEDIVIQLFTSGSTGTPKAIGHTNAGMTAYMYDYMKESRWEPEDIYQTSANLFHLSGLSVLTSLMVGSTTVFFARFDLIEFLTVMEREKTTRISFVPTLVTRLLNDSRLKNFHFDSVKKIVYGGSPMNYTTVVRAMEHFHCQLEQAYGATESCCMSVLLPEDHRDCAKGILDKKVLNSAGRPLPMVKVRIITEKGYETNGQACGEIEIKSPFLCSESMSVPGTRTEDGYYPTGDIGYMDEKGFLYLVGRKHDMIISGGENIYPKEVEDCIASLKQDVKQVCVLGMPDPVWGEQVTACIVLKEGSKLTEDDIVAWCKKHIARYKKPRKVIFFSQLPENANGKVSRILLKDQIQKGEIRS